MVVVGYVELDDFDVGFDALVTKFLDSVVAGGNVAAGEDVDGGWETLGDELDDRKSETLVASCCENDLRSHSRDSVR